jgi:hypothetical protein
LKKFGLSYLLSVAYGQAGRNGGKGGNGAPPGKPGCGGDGGNVDVASFAALSVPLVVQTYPGKAGVCGAPGQRGVGAPGGLGGLHRLYRYEWFKRTISPLLNSRVAEVREARKTYQLGERAATGQPGPDGLDSDVTYSATAGDAGAVSCRQVEAHEMAAAVDADLLRQMDIWARQALACDARDAAEGIVRWALLLLDASARPEEASVLRESFARLLTQIAALEAVAERVSAQ